MEEQGVIQANIAVINPAQIGHRITIIVEVELVSEQIDLIDEVNKSFYSVSEIQQCYYVTGETDFILIGVV